jgi:hypothetical protein
MGCYPVLITVVGSVNDGLVFAVLVSLTSTK